MESINVAAMVGELKMQAAMIQNTIRTVHEKQEELGKEKAFLTQAPVIDKLILITQCTHLAQCIRESYNFWSRMHDLLPFEGQTRLKDLKAELVWAIKQLENI